MPQPPAGNRTWVRWVRGALRPGASPGRLWPPRNMTQQPRNSSMRHENLHTVFQGLAITSATCVHLCKLAFTLSDLRLVLRTALVLDLALLGHASQRPAVLAASARTRTVHHFTVEFHFPALRGFLSCWRWTSLPRTAALLELLPASARARVVAPDLDALDRSGLR